LTSNPSQEPDEPRVSKVTQNITFTTGYSQYGQDLWVLDTFFPGRMRMAETSYGFFLELGAYHGQLLSNTFLLEQTGWHGVAVDPFPVQASWVDRKNAGLKGKHVLIQSAVAGQDMDNVDFLVDGEDGGPGSGFVSSLKHMGGYKEVDYNSVIKITTVNIKSILEDKIAEPDSKCIIMYLSIDTEGSELEILQSFPFEKFLIMTISVEHNNKRLYKDQIHQYLVERGYHEERMEWDPMSADGLYRTQNIDQLKGIPVCNLKDYPRSKFQLVT